MAFLVFGKFVDERSKYMDERNNDVHPQILNAHPRILRNQGMLYYNKSQEEIAGVLYMILSNKRGGVSHG